MVEAEAELARDGGGRSSASLRSKAKGSLGGINGPSLIMSPLPNRSRGGQSLD